MATNQHNRADGIASRASFDRIRYANCWEDADLLVGALTPAPGQRILSIASAGDNCLELASHGADVVAVDLSAAQLACLELRMAAIRALEHGELLAFLGVSESPDRAGVYRSLRDDLSESARGFWDRHPGLISGGIIHAGKFERFFQVFRRWVLPLIHPASRVRSLPADRTPGERIAFYERHWNNRRWRLLFRVFFGRFVMGRLGRDPAFFQHVEGDVASQILARVRIGMTAIPTDSNPWLRCIITGNFGDALPPYLRPERYAELRRGCSRIELVHGSLADVLRREDASFHAANLSDIFEYLSAEECHELYAALLERAHPGARIAYWNMLVPRRCPEGLRHRVQHLSDLARRLFAGDRAFFYREFVVEEVLGAKARPGAKA